MSMLSERRQRKRYNLVPRGKALYEDGNRFGTKMLEKMGWSKGKGLGANENGDKEFVRIRYKHDNEGLGFEDRDDQWTQHENDFNGLLKTLGGGEGSDSNSQNGLDEDMPTTIGFGFQPKEEKATVKIAISGESLEAKSKNSKARVHYMKFTRGKDISRYSEKELANIFGKKSFGGPEFQQFPEISPNISKPSSQEASDGEGKPNPFGVMTINTGTSMTDYFKIKMEKFRNKLNGSGERNEQVADEVECGVNGPVEEEPADSKRKSKKKKKQSVDVEPEAEVIPICENVNVDGKKKSKRKLDVETISEIIEDNEQEGEPKAKRKKSKKGKVSDVVEEDLTAQKNTESETRPKKLRKSKDGCPVDGEKPFKPIEICSAETEGKSSKIKSEPAADDDQEMVDASSNVPVTETKPKKPKRKTKEAAILEDNETTEISEGADANFEPTSFTKGKKEKKVKHSKKRDLLGLEEAITTEKSMEQSVDEKEIEKKEVLPERVDEICEADTVKPKKLKSATPNPAQSSATADTSNDDQVRSSSSSQNPSANQFRFPELNIKKKKKIKKITQSTDTSTIDDKITPITSTVCNPVVTEDNEEYYILNAFKAEKFYNVDLDAFHGSNLAHITGYAQNNNIDIKIKERDSDNLKIRQMYDDNFDRKASSRKVRGKPLEMMKIIKKRKAFPVI